MSSVSQVEMSLKHILEERANVLARETGCIERQRKFGGADLLQTLVFGWLAHPEGSLEMLASTTATRQVQVTDTAVHKRFTQPCAQFLHAILEEMTRVVVEADSRWRWTPGRFSHLQYWTSALYPKNTRPTASVRHLRSLVAYRCLRKRKRCCS